jgi:hypothetical protein
MLKHAAIDYCCFEVARFDHAIAEVFVPPRPSSIINGGGMRGARGLEIEGRILARRFHCSNLERVRPPGPEVEPGGHCGAMAQERAAIEKGRPTGE